MDNDMETVYGTHEDSHVMSERVQSLASSIYKEFERMIKKYDEDVVKELMPLVVGILESLDLAYTENQEHDVELELLREDNEQLVTQYEREKQHRKTAEQKFLEVEDAVEEERQEQQGKVESLESIVRMLELKSRNSADHVSRLEEKELDNKKEYNKLHERYTELFKTHMDYMERTKILMGAERIEALNTPRGRLGLNLIQVRPGHAVSYNSNSAETPVRINDVLDFGTLPSPTQSQESGFNLRSELQESQALESRKIPGGFNKSFDSQGKRDVSDKSQVTDTLQHRERATATSGGWVDGMDSNSIPTPELEDIEDISGDTSIGPELIKPMSIHHKRTNSLYQELCFQDSDALGEMDEGADITGIPVHPGEFASSGSDTDSELDVNDNFFGMGKEVENLIMENNELLETKNALNIVKDDLIAKVDELTSEQEILREEIDSLQAVKTKLKQRVSELEDELKRVKEEAEKATKSNKSDDEDVPMAQRKRFTRVEMARVLMERNQYKERLMELQEAVRWTEMIRASRHDPTMDAKKNKSSIWKFFSNLFSSTERPLKRPQQYVNVKYNAPTHHVTPAVDPLQKKKIPKHKAFDFLDNDIASEKIRQQRDRERREQYKQVRAHVKKDDGRMQAYGWSLPAKAPTSAKSENANIKTSNSNIPVPVPVYCRPLMEKEPGMKIWCAAGVNLTGGRTRDGGSIVGASVFYSNPPDKETDEESEKTDTQTDIEKLDHELKANEKDRKEIESLEKNLSPLVWICTSTHSSSKVTVIDANNPADVLDSFYVCTSHLLCIASVPGAKEGDYTVNEEMSPLDNKKEDNVTAEESQPTYNSTDNESTKIGSITFVSCTTGSYSSTASPCHSPTRKESTNELFAEVTSSDAAEVAIKTAGVDSEGNFECLPSLAPPRLIKEGNNLYKDGVMPLPTDNEQVCEEVEKMSSVLPTMWLGSQSGSIYVHSAVAHWNRCLHSIKLRDSVLSIVHVKGRVLIALADGTVAIFHRAEDGQWDLLNYHILDLGKPHHSIRCMVVVHNKVWCGYRNKIHVVEPRTMTVEKSFDAHPRKESQVRQMAWVGEGVWVSIRLDSTLRLYHAHTHQHLQDVDIEPYVSKMLGTGKLGFSFVRITALLISCNRLWMGTGNGVIISVPLSEHSRISTNTGGNRPGGPVRVYSDSKDYMTPGSFIPYCSMAQAQLSFHGHRDAVKFFVSVPGCPSNSGLSVVSSTSTNNKEKSYIERKRKGMLVISGGEGYIDFRIEMSDVSNADTEQISAQVWRNNSSASPLQVGLIQNASGDGDDDDNDNSIVKQEGIEMKQQGLSKGDRSHLIVWQVLTGD